MLAPDKHLSAGPYFCDCARNGSSISVKIADFVNVHANLVEVVLALI
jgi:hypothetical protein